MDNSDVRYPKDCKAFMPEAGPSDPELVVPGGKLIFNPRRDERFPYIYEVPSHPLVDAMEDKSVIKNIWVYIQDTSKEGLKKDFEFEQALYVPLGPDSSMKEIGQLEATDGTVIYARPKGCSGPERDFQVSTSFLGSRVFPQKYIDELAIVRDDFLGKKEHMTLDPPQKVNGELVGGIHFERLGQEGVKGTRCYSMTLSHQSQRGIVGPTAGGKVYDRGMTDNERIRQNTVQLTTKMAAEAISKVAPASYKSIMEQNAEANNVPRIGVKENVYFPACQGNPAPAVPHSACYSQGLKGMGEFGSLKGHRDKKDSEGGSTTIIANSRLPPGYEHGRFHLLHLGVYVRLQDTMMSNFCGLNLHGGTPPIAPPGEEVVAHAYRLVHVCYPPSSMLSGSGVFIAPLASLPKGQMLSLGPEITTLLELVEKEVQSNEACWTLDGGVVMQPFSHFQHVSRLLLLLASYIFRQFSPGYRAGICPKTFLESLTMELQTNEGESTIPQRVSAGAWDYAPTGASLKPGSIESISDVPTNPETAGKRQQHYLNWIQHCEARAKFVPFCYDFDYDAERQKLFEGKLQASRPKGASGRKRPASEDANEEGKKVKKPRNEEPLANVALSMLSEMTRVPIAPVPTLEPLPDSNTDDGGIQSSFQQCEDFGEVQPPDTDIEMDVVVPSGNGAIVETSPTLDALIDRTDGIRKAAEKLLEFEDGESEIDHEEEWDISHPHHRPSGLAIADIIDSEDDVNEECNEPAIADDNGECDEETQFDQSHSLAGFLKSLNADIINSTIRDFREALKVKKKSDSLAVVQLATTTCYATINTVRNLPTSPDTAMAVKNLWDKVRITERGSAVAKVTTYATQAITMLSTWTLFDWITGTVNQALPTINGPNATSWISKLLKDILTDIQVKHRTKSTSTQSTLDPHHYLPDIVGATSYHYLPPRFYLPKGNEVIAERMQKGIASIAIDAISFWLDFPTDRNVAIKSSLVGTLMECELTAILFLEPVWKAFKNPATVLCRKGDKPASDAHKSKVLKEFYGKFLSHPILTQGSDLNNRLNHLHELIMEWGDLTPIRSIKRHPRVQLPDPVMAPITSQEKEEGMNKFVQFLQDMYPLLQDGLQAHQASKNPILRKAAHRPDFLLPFRSHAPMVVMAKSTILSDAHRLGTRAGLFNLAAFRGVFYGSKFAEKDLRWFDSYDDWLTVYNSRPCTENADSIQIKKEKKKYFVNPSAYGSGQDARDTDNLAQYWTACDEWEPWLQNHPGRDPKEMYRFFVDHFRNVGPLAALLMIGDLVECGFIPAPDPRAFGRLVAETQKGGLKAMVHLRMVDCNADEETIAATFAELDEHCRRLLDDGTQQGMGYGVVVLEHSLCKYLRAYNIKVPVGFLPKSRRSKRSKKK